MIKKKNNNLIILNFKYLNVYKIHVKNQKNLKFQQKKTQSL